MTKKDSDKAARPCSGCPLVRNTINGHYCPRLGIKTQYAPKKPCDL